MTSETTNRKNAWYRQPLVWMLIAIPASAVIFGIAMLVLSIRSYDGLVIDDYYKKGKTINRVLIRDEEAARRGIGGTLNIDLTEKRFSLTMVKRSSGSLPDLLTLKLLHATRSGVDQKVVMLRTPIGTYQGFMPTLIEGRWYLHLETQQWRILGEWVYPQAGPVLLRPTSLVEQG